MTAGLFLVLSLFFLFVTVVKECLTGVEIRRDGSWRKRNLKGVLRRRQD